MNDYFNHVANVIDSGVRALSAQINNIANEISTGLDKLPTEIQIKEGRIRYAVDSGVADAYVITLPHLPTLTDGFNFIWKAANANTGPATINVNGLGAKSIILASGGALISGDIIANQQLWCSYESVGDNFRLLSQSSSAGGGGGNAATIALLDESVDTTNFVTFANNATGNQALFSGSNLTFDAATGNLAATIFTGALIGNVTGNADTATTAGTVTTAAQPNITSLGLITTFASTGIDDNATGERMKLSDAELILGATGLGWIIRNAVNDQNLVLSGGNVSNVGANIRMDGGASISTGDMLFRNDGNTWMQWDESIGGLRLDTGIGVKTQALFIASDQLVTFAGGVVVQGAFTSLGIDDNATAERVQINDTTLVVGASGGSYSIERDVDDQDLRISGGNTNISGANLVLYGGTHANTGDFQIRNDSNALFIWDESVGDLEFLTGIGVKTSALEITVAQDFDMHGHIRMDEEANVAAPTAGKARWWVRDDVPNVPMFTDDTDVDHVLALRASFVEGSAENSSLVTVSSSVIDVVTLNLGTVVVGARILLNWRVFGTKGGTAGRVDVFCVKHAGTATINFFNSIGNTTQSVNQNASEAYGHLGFGIAQVTVGGTLTVKIQAASVGSDLPVSAGNGEIYAMVLNTGIL